MTTKTSTKPAARSGRPPVGSTRGKAATSSATFSLTLTAKMLEGVRRHARKNKVTVSAAFRSLIEAGMAQAKAA